jgi:hypothetical protein
VVRLPFKKEDGMKKTTLTRRTLLRTGALATTALAVPFVRSSEAAATVVPKGKMVLAWHTNITSRWLDPQQHDACPTNSRMMSRVPEGDEVHLSGADPQAHRPART